MLEDKVDEKFYLSQDKVERFIKNNNGKLNMNKSVLCTCHERNDLSFATRDRVYNPEMDSPTLTATMYKDAPKVIQIGNCMHITNRANPNQGRVYDENGISPTLTTMQGGNLQPMIITLGNVNPSGKGMNGNVISSEGLCSTLTTVQKDNYVLEPKKAIIDDTYSNREHRIYEEYSPTLRIERQGFKTIDGDLRIRKLTPRECFRLMGFDDSDFDKVEGNLSNSQLYKMAGNSIVVNVLEEIYKRLFKAIKL